MNQGSVDHTVRFARPLRPKKIKVTFEISEPLWKDATILCELTREEIITILEDQGVQGLRNYVAHKENWK
jgi:hypothetical protein